MARMLIQSTIMDSEVEAIVALRIETLKTESDGVLEIKLKEGIKFANERDFDRTPLSLWNVVGAPIEFYDGIVAMRLLKERHDEDYVLSLMGYRKPKTIWEKVKYSITGELPYTDICR